MSKIDLSVCKRGQKLVSKCGLILTYIEPLPEENYYDHLVNYPDGTKGTRCNDGYVFRNIRNEEYDYDIIEILPLEE